MTRFLLFRPVAVLVVTLALSVLGVIVFRLLPVSLLPNIAVPEITVQVNYPNAAAPELQQSIIAPLKNQLLQVNHLSDIEAKTQDGFAVLKLRFDFGTDIRLAYLETNEKIDGIVAQLPRDLERPKVIKAGAGDIAVFQLNVSSSKGKSTSSEAFRELSDFCQNVLKRRLEQLPEVALVDATGLAVPEILVSIDREKMQSLRLTESQVTELLRQNNVTFGNVTVKDGQYQYNIRFSSLLRNPQDIKNIPLRLGKGQSRVIRLGDLVKVEIREQPQQGLYTFNGQRAVCLAIIKQSDAQLLQMREQIDELLAQFQKDYPDLHFALSQDQTELLEISINNLVSNILTGALLTFVMIFFFLPNPRVPLIIGVVIPVSLCVTFLGFYFIGLSINIVSLAGLVLGIGEIIDSAIVIIENIEDKREEGLPLDEACITGAEEIIRPLFTSVLTNSAVFLPLIFLSGLAGALFFDQAVSVSLALGVSLLTSYTLIPVLYRLAFRKSATQNFYLAKQTWLTKQITRFYNLTFRVAFRFRYMAWVLVIAILGSAWGSITQLEKRGMPTVSRSEMEIKLNWNEPLSVDQNQKRVTALFQQLSPSPLYVSAYIGPQQFLLNQDLQQSFGETTVNLKVNSPEVYQQMTATLEKLMRAKFPNALMEIRPARNVFEQLFGSNQAPLRLQVFATQGNQVPSLVQINRLGEQLQQNNLPVSPTASQQRWTIQLQEERLLLYNVDAEQVYESLKTLFNSKQAGQLQSGSKVIPIVLATSQVKSIHSMISSAFVPNRQQEFIPLRELITLQHSEDYRLLYIGKEGPYVPFDIETSNVPAAMSKIEAIVQQDSSVGFRFTGGYFQNIAYLQELAWVVLIAIGLLFCILTAQFESLLQPLIVMLTALLGISGALITLFVFGESLNALSLIGVVVLIGLIDNDSILKIDTMNRERERVGLIEAIRLSGQRRLKSQLMTYLTTVLGLFPVLFSGGLGAELQRPLALTVIGGMTLGVIASWTLIPLLYYWVTPKKRAAST